MEYDIRSGATSRQVVEMTVPGALSSRSRKSTEWWPPGPARSCAGSRRRRPASGRHVEADVGRATEVDVHARADRRDEGAVAPTTARSRADHADARLQPADGFALGVEHRDGGPCRRRAALEVEGHHAAAALAAPEKDRRRAAQPRLGQAGCSAAPRERDRPRREERDDGDAGGGQREAPQNQCGRALHAGRPGIT